MGISAVKYVLSLFPFQKTNEDVDTTTQLSRADAALPTGYTLHPVFAMQSGNKFQFRPKQLADTSYDFLTGYFTWILSH